MKGLIVKLAKPFLLVLFVVSCASSPKNYRVELVDQPEGVQKQETIDTYEKFPYIDFRSSRY